jgi:ankyrin repeat protein
LLVVQNGHIEALEVLIKSQDSNGNFTVDLNNGMNNTTRLVHIAIQKGHVPIIKLLLEAKNPDGSYRVDFNAAMKNSATPACFAAQQKDPTILKLLLDAKNSDEPPRVDFNLASTQGTPLDIAIALNNTAHIELLKNEGIASLNCSSYAT